MRTFTLLILSVWIATFQVVMARAPADQKAPGVRGDVLAAVEKELARLSKQADQEPGSVYPRPSSVVAYLLLTGLAGQGSEIRQPPEEAFRQLGITISNRVSVQLFTVAEDARIAISASVVEDKAGPWTSKRATLYRRHTEKWVERGNGYTASDGVTLPK